MVNLNRRESSRTPTNYDPRPLHLRSVDTKALDILRTDLLNINQHSALNCILVPCCERALHEHTYSRQLEGDTSESVPEASYPLPTPAICPFDAEEMKERCKTIKQGLQVSSEVRQKIEQATCLQAQCNVWYEVRQKRVTGYKCEQILGQKTRTPALLRSVLYNKPLDPFPAPIKWGQDNEAAARKAYVDAMHQYGHPTLSEWFHYSSTRRVVWFVPGWNRYRQFRQHL